jgi:hypothetical protein
MKSGSFKAFIIRFIPALFLILFSCTEQQVNTIPPEIAFIAGEGYISADTSLTMGSRVKIGIHAQTMGANITYMNVAVDNGSLQTLLDSGMNCPSLTYKYTLIKGSSESENWTFTVMDKDRNKTSIHLNIAKAASSSFGNIISYDHLTIGAQNNSTTGSFFSLGQNAVYDLEQAYSNQGLIDIIYYYATYLATLSSPAENDVKDIFMGTHGISNWATMNETRYDTTMVTPAQFDACSNDSLLVVSYDAINAKRKAKFLEEGQVLSFIATTGKLGLIKVISVNGTDAGEVQLSIKIQE